MLGLGDRIASGRGSGGRHARASVRRRWPASAVSSSPPPSSARPWRGASERCSVSAGRLGRRRREENPRSELWGSRLVEQALEDAREDRELREVDETVDAALRRMKTKGAFPERLTAEEMRRLVDECRSEQGA